MNQQNIIQVRLWDDLLGIIFWDETKNETIFEFNKAYKNKEIVSAPLIMPYPSVPKTKYAGYYYNLKDSFKGLPPMIADALPDSYGEKVVVEYLKANGHSETVSPIRLLSYIGTRGMGALEFIPESHEKEKGEIKTDLANLARLSNQIIKNRADSFKLTREELFKLFQFSTSAGGAKPKVILSYNKNKGIYSFPYDHQEGFTPLIIKFDSNTESGEALDSGRTEYIYHKMALAAGIEMNPCGYFKDGGKSHFFTTRFDRTSNGEKIHMQTLAALTGKNPRQLHSYDLVFKTILKLNLGQKALIQQFRIMVFNYLATNDDYHIKNIAFLMSQNGNWSLSPAYDITFPYDYNNVWLKTQPLTINNKSKGITLEDFITVGKKYGIKQIQKIILEVKDALSQFEKLAIKNKLPEHKTKIVKSHFREI